VDFDCIFEKGAKLKVPEIVPFRLTANIIDAFGIFKEKGIFQKCAEVVLRVMRKNQKNIISYLDSFKHDPLVENPPNIKVEIKDALEVIEKKLMGNINIGSGVALTVEE
jgi:phosphatidylinositol kinase/protein kinase (PI-3  family)